MNYFSLKIVFPVPNPLKFKPPYISLKKPKKVLIKAGKGPYICTPKTDVPGWGGPFEVFSLFSVWEIIFKKNKERIAGTEKGFYICTRLRIKGLLQRLKEPISSLWEDARKGRWASSLTY